LSEKEIKKLKKETLYNHDPANEMLSDMIYDEVFEFSHFRSYQEATAISLHRYLTYEQSVLEFRDLKYRFWKETEEDKAVLKNLDLRADGH